MFLILAKGIIFQRDCLLNSGDNNSPHKLKILIASVEKRNMEKSMSLSLLSVQLNRIQLPSKMLPVWQCPTAPRQSYAQEERWEDGEENTEHNSRLTSKGCNHTPRSKWSETVMLLSLSLGPLGRACQWTTSSILPGGSVYVLVATMTQSWRKWGQQGGAMVEMLALKTGSISHSAMKHVGLSWESHFFLSLTYLLTGFIVKRKGKGGTI